MNSVVKTITVIFAILDSNLFKKLVVRPVMVICTLIIGAWVAYGALLLSPIVALIAYMHYDEHKQYRKRRGYYQ